MVRMCSRGVWDTTMPGITFDEEGVSNYYKIMARLTEAYPRGLQGKLEWEKIAQKIKKDGREKKYDCVLGVSGGTDSSYLMHIAIQYGLRPLAVNFDNGWNSDISVKNIKKVTSKLKIDLETYVIDYEEMKNILRSYMKASLPWIDNPTDQAIKAVLFKIANREGIKYILNGHDFRSEGKQPVEWTYGDSKQLKSILKRYGTCKLKTFPYLTFSKLVYLSYVKGIKVIKPLFYLDYQKKTAQEILKKEYDWEYYGGHHHENVFTKFSISYWLRNKFNIDKRKITLSAQIVAGEISRDEAINQLKKPPYDPEQMERDKFFVMKKLDLTESDFKKLMDNPNRTFMDYPSYYPVLLKFLKVIKPILSNILKTTLFYEFEERSDLKK